MWFAIRQNAGSIRCCDVLDWTDMPLHQVSTLVQFTQNVGSIRCCDIIEWTDMLLHQVSTLVQFRQNAGSIRCCDVIARLDRHAPTSSIYTGPVQTERREYDVIDRTDMPLHQVSTLVQFRQN